MNYKLILIIYLIYLIIVSFISFIMYAVDKHRAIKHLYRISEKALLLSSIFGGAIGSLMGSLMFRHKTNKWYFKFTIFIALIYQIAIAVILFLSWKNII